MKLTPGGRTALWIGCGGFIGLGVGAMLVDPGQAVFLSPFWIIGLALFIGIVVGFTRAPRDAKDAHEATGARTTMPAARAVAIAPTAPDALTVRFELPDIPAGYPAVLGRGEPVHVRIRVYGQQQPAEGAGVQLSAALAGESLTGDGLTGTDGTVAFTLEPEGTGELLLNAEAKLGARTGHGTASASLVSYEEEIERLFGEFRAYAVGVLGTDAMTDTARELCDRLRTRSDSSTARALLELARVYELVAYGERPADRRLYLALLEQLMVLEHAELPGDPGAVTREA